MSTTTLRLEMPLKQRFAQLAEALGQTSHSLMLEALGQKADEMEERLAFSRLAAQRYSAIEAGGPVVEWADMKAQLRERLKPFPAPALAAKKSTKAKAAAQ